jgi:peptide/nickel transport system substrate-binding protein
MMYPYDARRAEQLLNEEGIVRSSTGVYQGPAGEPFHIQLQGDIEREILIITDSLRGAGISADVNVLSPAQVRDRANLTNFPALAMQRNHYEVGSGFFSNFHSSRIATAQTQYVGSNRGAYTNPELDGVIDMQIKDLELESISRLHVETARLVAEQIPGIPLYGTVSIDVYPSTLRGPGPIATDTSLTWNVHEWQWAR